MDERKRALGSLGMALALSSLAGAARAKGTTAELATFELTAPELDEKLLAYNDIWNHPQPMAPLSNKEQLRRKNRREMAYESRRRNRRKKS